VAGRVDDEGAQRGLGVSVEYADAVGRGEAANLEAVATAMNYRPNQNPLISALKDTIAYQSKLMAQMEILQSAQAGQNANSAVMGAGQMPGASNPNQLGTGPATISVVPTAPAAVPAAPATVPAAPATP
jgi:hypothetical protein